MKIAVLGATGTIGRSIVKEALARGHSVSAAARNPPQMSEKSGCFATLAIDATQATELERGLAGHDAVVSAVGPTRGSPPSVIVDATRAIAAATMRSGVRRIVIVGGAGSLTVKPGVELLATPEFPEAWRGIALAHREALEVWRRVKELAWTYASPAATIEPGVRTGKYRTGHDDLLVDENGRSHISTEDFAVAILDELEHNTHPGERVTFAY